MPVLDEYKLIADVCKRSYFEFIKEFWDVIIPEKPVWNWHIKLIADELQTVCERIFAGKPKEYDLIINISPGTTKSTAASVLLLPWCWTRMPSLRSLHGSHTHELVLELSRKSREVIYSEKYQRCFPGVALREDQNTKGNWANTQGGSRFSCTVGGKSPIGMHAHIQVIDDPIDPQKAVSDVEIEVANTWMIETLSTRKVDKAVTPLVLIMQRLAQNDPSGFLLERGKKIRHINLPAEETRKISPPYLRDFYIDGLMDPVRLSRSVLDEFRDGGDYFFSGQFLQDPIPLGGGMFKVNMLVEDRYPPPDSSFRRIVRCWDNAGSPKKSGSDRRRAYTVGLKMGFHRDGSFWILDCIRGRFRVDEREKIKKTAARRDGSHVEIIQEQEGGSGGQESAEDTVRHLAGYNVRINNPKGEKLLRAEPLARQVNIGNVHIVEGSWNKEYKDEMKNFPYSTFKDQIDASSAAFNTLFKPRRRAGALLRR